jgi:hypothetical protein
MILVCWVPEISSTYMHKPDFVISRVSGRFLNTGTINSFPNSDLGKLRDAFTR